MKTIRKIARPFALVICTGLILSIAGYASALGASEPERLSDINQLSIHSLQFDAQSLFTRQTGDSETESEDEVVRQDSKVLHALVSRELSFSVSSSVHQLFGQLPPYHIAGIQRCILFRHLTI